MEIRVLGCHGSQFPGYNTTSFLVDHRVLVDAGTVTSVLTAEEQVMVDGVCITHSHLDHVRDLMLLVDNLVFLKKDRPLVVMGTPSIIETVKTCFFNNRVWPDFSVLPDPGHPALRYLAIEEGQRLTLSGFEVEAVRVDHTVETVAYLLSNPGGSVMFVGDTGPTDRIWLRARQDPKLQAIFLETSLPDAMQDLADLTGHLTPSRLRLELEKLGPPFPPIYLYHLKIHQRETIEEEIARLGNPAIRIVADGQVIRLGIGS